MSHNIKWSDDWKVDKLRKEGRWEAEKYISAPGLVPLVKGLRGESQYIRGIEIGVAAGWNMHHFLEEIPELLLVGVDPFFEYTDRGILISQEEQDQRFYGAMYNVGLFNGRGHIIRESSYVAHSMFADGVHDYIFIDGDHSLDAVYNDCVNWYSKVRSGGIFSGHDFGIVSQAVLRFREGKDLPEIKFVVDGVWYWEKP